MHKTTSEALEQLRTTGGARDQGALRRQHLIERT